jgi:hypothetical protein
MDASISTKHIRVNLLIFSLYLIRVLKNNKYKALFFVCAAIFKPNFIVEFICEYFKSNVSLSKKFWLKINMTLIPKAVSDARERKDNLCYCVQIKTLRAS